MDASEASDNQAEKEVGPSEKVKKGKVDKTSTKKTSKGVRTRMKRTPGDEGEEPEPGNGEDVLNKVVRERKERLPNPNVLLAHHLAFRVEEDENLDRCFLNL